MKGSSSENTILLFDGVCSLCNSAIDFVIRHERGDYLTFASLQSDLAKTIIDTHAEGVVPDSLIFFHQGRLYTESDAVIEAARFLRHPYNWIVVGRILPLGWRNGMYRWVARNRYRWFGKRNTCRVPTERERGKILG